jgi:N-acetyldiaminopimelate deacetylase
MDNVSPPSLLGLPFNKELTAVRKKLHQIPEIAFQEYKTIDFILNYVGRFPELKLHTFPFPGLIAEYSQGEGEYILFRTDMDALPVTEQTGCDFSSLHSGMMHACGHDVHMTILLGLIEDVVKAKVKKNILFLFQPAEEGKGGAQKIIETGVLQQFRIKEVYALHVHPDLPVDTISSCPGTIFGIPLEIDVIFKGKSAHAANPQKGKDALMAAAQFLSSYNTLLSKSFPVDSLVLAHFGKIEGGTARNIVSDHCLIEGTLRAFTRDDMKKLKKLITDVAKSISPLYGLTTEINELGTYDAVVNSRKLYDKLKQHLPSEVKFREALPALTGEDFGFFTSLYDGLLFWVGADCKTDLHSPTFLPDERVIETGLRVFKSLIVENL